MVKLNYIQKNFHKQRSGRIGSSDVAKMLPNPENPVESLAGYGQTALTVYKEKIGELERTPPGLPAEMGHYMENKSLELFIRNFYDRETARNFMERKMIYESREDALPENYQVLPFHHNVQYFTDGVIVHPDMVYDGSAIDYQQNENGVWEPKRDHNGIIVDFSSPFIVEAKSAQLFATKRRSGFVKGYDFDLKGHQGIPLKHYVQIQYQLALMEIDTAYLSLLYDTSNYHVWKVPADRKWQGRIIDIVGKMIKHINDRTMPRELAMNQADVMELYPEIDKDYCLLMGDELEKVKGLCKAWKKADEQEKKWKAQKKDAADALSVGLKGFEELRDSDGCLAKWQFKKGSIGLQKPDPEKKDGFLKQVQNVDPVTYKYLERKGYIAPGKDSRYVSVKFKGDE